LIGVIVLAFLIVKYKTHSCDYCHFQWKGEKISVNEFTGIYFDECLKNEDGFFNLTFFNLTSNQPNLPT
jgi:hypothetical protein